MSSLNGRLESMESNFSAVRGEVQEMRVAFLALRDEALHALYTCSDSEK